MERICKTCGLLKKHAGKGLCRKCYDREHHILNKTVPERREKVKEQMRKRAERRRLKNPEKIREYNREYMRTYTHLPEVAKKYATRAQTIKSISKKKSCKFCGSEENLEYHHLSYDDYDKVITICKKCHLRIHDELRLKELTSKVK